MSNCWQEDPDDRPTFEGLRGELKRMENQHKVNSLESKQQTKKNSGGASSRNKIYTHVQPTFELLRASSSK